MRISDWSSDVCSSDLEEHFRYAQLSVGGKVLREAVGSFSRPGRPVSENPKKQVTLRLDPDVIEKFRATGKGWQSRINAELRKEIGRASCRERVCQYV